jgi:hypothetical protein
MKNYTELKHEQAPMIECFFAFDKKQFDEGVKKAGIEGKKILTGPAGLFGTREGISQFMDFYDKLSDQIGLECDPQEVYDDEFVNHECDYTGDDEEAIKIVVSYFSDDRSKEVKRRYARTPIENLNFN